MNIHCFLFVYNKNKEATPYTVKCLRWAAAKLRSYDSVKITVADDARHPAFTDKKEQEGLKAIGVDEYVQTPFPRRGNIRGQECLIGMLRLYNSTSCKTDWVIQCDNDMLLKTFEHLRIDGGDISGVRDVYEPPNGQHVPDMHVCNYTYGPGTAIRRKFLPRMIAALEQHPVATCCKEDEPTDCFYGYVAIHAGGLLSIHTSDYQSYTVTPEYRYFAAYLMYEPYSKEAKRESYMVDTNCHMWEGDSVTIPMRMLSYRLLGFDPPRASLEDVQREGAVFRRPWGLWTLVREWWTRRKHRSYLRHLDKHAIIAG